MDDLSNNAMSVPVSGEGPGVMRLRVARALRIVPAIAAMTIWIGLIGACGRSPWSVSNNPTPTPTITTSPTTGTFLYSSNFGDGRVARFTRNLTTGGLSFTGSTAAGAVNGPAAMANGLSAKILYVTNSATTANDVFQFKINSTSGALTAIASPVAAGKSPLWIAVTPNVQFAFVTNSADGTISQYTVNTTTGELTANGTFTSNLLSSPFAAVASNTFLYVTDSTKGTVVSFPISTTGTLSGGTPTTIPVASPKPGPIIMNSTGQFVYVTDSATGLVYFFTINPLGVLVFNQSQASTTVSAAGLVLTTTPLGVQLLFVSNPSVPSISIFIVGSTGQLTFSSPATDPSLDLPAGMVADPLGNWLYVANEGNGTITQFTISTATGTPALIATTVTNTESPTSEPVFLSLGD